jgi:Tfp pilus tip-associated adhesin PilY1
MRKLSFLAIIAVFLWMGAVPLRADDTVLFTANVSPDALIALDLSGSMGQNPGGESNYQATWVAPDRGDGYPDYCTDEKTYGAYSTAHPWRCLDEGAHIYGTPTCAEPWYDWSGGGHTTDCTKLVIAKRAIFDLLDANDGGSLTSADETSLNVRFGYMRFVLYPKDIVEESVNYSAGYNTLRRAFDFKYKTLYDSYISVESGGGRTPLALQLKEAKKYLDDHKAGDTAKECRKKFIILVTDGWDTAACKIIGSEDEYTARSFGYKRRRATVAAVKDAVEAGYTVFTVGFGADMPATERNTLNWAAYLGGSDNLTDSNSGDTGAITFSANPCAEDDPCGAQKHDYVCTTAPNDPGYKNLSGYAFLASDSTTLATSLKTILKWIREKAFSFTAPTVPSTRVADPERVFISSFSPDTTPFWRGDMKAYELDANGTLPVDGDGFPSESPLWEASAILGNTNPDSRKIYTAKSGSRVEFKYANLTNGDLGVASDTERDDLIKHVRGFDAYDIDVDTNTSESRRFKLGDIFHSQATVVGAPSMSFVDQGFNGTGGFYDAKKNRTKVILAGANDGMLHAFDAGTGEEKWAFIPPSLLTGLKTMKTRWDQYKSTGSAGDHLYYVDSSPRVSDVWFYSAATDTTKTVDEWRTVLINGLRKGGKTYFALDITDTTDPVYLWEFPKSTDATTLNKVGQSWSDPAVGKVKVEVGGELYERWVAFFGGGYDDYAFLGSNKGKAFFVVDIKTGDILWEFSYDGADSEKSKMIHALPAPPSGVDTNMDGYIDKVYVGDLGGTMWVFDLSYNPVTKKSNSLWSGKRLFRGTLAILEVHPLYFQPAVAFDQQGTPWVFFGTGDKENPTWGLLAERFYGIKDDGAGNYPRTESSSDLDNVTDSNTFTPTAKKGWYIKLATGLLDMTKHEQPLGKATVFNRLVYFTTFTPKESDTDVCTTGGTAKLYIMEYLSGGGALAVDDVSDLSGAAGARSKVIGSGMPSAPIVTIDAQGQATVVIGTTEGQAYSQEVFSPDTNRNILYWRDID